MTKKIRLILIAMIALMLGLWVWTLAMSRDYLTIGGSASVDLILQRATGKYKKAKEQTLIFSSTGSQAGMNDMLKDVYDIGFLSRKLKDGPEQPEQDFDNDNTYWTSEKFDPQMSSEKYLTKVKSSKHSYHKLTFAIDAIVLVYYPPASFDKDFQDKFVVEIEPQAKTKAQIDQQPKMDISKNLTPQEVIQPIFAALKTDTRWTWRQLAQAIANKHPEDTKLQSKVSQVSQAPIESYTMDPGSGTRSSFETAMGIKIGKANNVYSNNGSIFYQIDKSVGSIGYMSQSYAQHLKESGFSHLKSVTIATAGKNEMFNPNTTDSSPDVNTDLAKYPLTRPFNAVFKGNKDEKKLKKIVDFLFWLATDPSLVAAFKEEGLDRPLAQQTAELFKEEVSHV
ncbi:phosphate ABC transporter substrate-binding protein [Williamsoniiplasma lucivorax]|uniref:Phosphate ABC transporter substrate-binding protein n=1 Tax=Williamsoniiplasma lucivorax TaxID=209274 RepID=A0A2S5R9U8_9MOLU|nr:phosphate ABC transporter substrate-binding protein [Williamsoniiplasma lucivorax]PPE04073.1 phosphate ABC transporter substrate-binding protein [Williamsoniiplasma lucivorax]